LVMRQFENPALLIVRIEDEGLPADVEPRAEAVLFLVRAGKRQRQAFDQGIFGRNGHGAAAQSSPHYATRRARRRVSSRLP